MQHTALLSTCVTVVQRLSVRMPCTWETYTRNTQSSSSIWVPTMLATDYTACCVTKQQLELLDGVG